MQVLDIAGVGPAAQSLNEDVRNAGHAAQVYVAVGLDVADCLVGGYESDLFPDREEYGLAVLQRFIAACHAGKMQPGWSDFGRMEGY